MTSTCTDVGGRGEWIPDPAQLVCQALGMQFPVLFLLSHNFVYISANCKLPEEPLHGFVLNYCNEATIEGSVIIFQCDPGFSPVAEMTVICNSSGQWSSDLSQLVCTGSDGEEKSLYSMLTEDYLFYSHLIDKHIPRTLT